MMRSLSRLPAAAAQRLLRAAAALDQRRRLRLLLTLLLLAPTALLLVLVVDAMAGRLSFPLDLEWLEGSQIYHAYRLLHGQPIYRLETAGFLPHPYPPLHAALVAAAGALFGLDYLSARAVSVAAFIVAGLVIVYQVCRHWPTRRGRVVLALVTAGYLAATYSMVHGWYDTARVDSLALVLVILAAAPLGGDRLRWWAVISSAALLAAAVYTKQTTALFAVGLCLLVFWRNKRQGLVMTAVLGALCVAALVILQRWTHGTFWIWLFSTRHHAFHPFDLLWGALLVLSRAPFLLLLPLLVRREQGRRRPSARSTLWLVMLVAALPAGLIPYAKEGGYINSLIPIWFLAGPAALILIGDLARSASAATRQQLLTIVLALQAIYLPFFVFDPARAVPDAKGRRAAASLNRTIASLDGGLVCPFYPYLPLRNGHRTPQASWIAHSDAWSGMPGAGAASYASWLHAVRPRWLLLSDKPVKEAGALRRAVGAGYALHRELDGPRLDATWLTNPAPRMLYRRVDRAVTGAP